MEYDLINRQQYLNRRIYPEKTFEELHSFPAYFEVETVNACNARCPMCTIEEWTRHSPTMKDDLFNKIADEICEHSDFVKRVALFRDGEPLLDKKLSSRIKKLRDGGIPDVNICTNVSLLTPERSEEILDSGVTDVLMSIDGTDKETFEAIRVKLNFEEVVNNAIKFIKLRDKINPDTKVRIRMIRQDKNKHQWPDFKRFWEQYTSQNDKVYYTNIHNWGNQLKNFKPISMGDGFAHPCIAPWSLMTIFSNGDAPLCNIDFNNNYLIGEVRTQSIKDVWNSPQMKEYRELHITGRRNEIPICEHCTVWDEPEKHVDIEAAE